MSSWSVPTKFYIIYIDTHCRAWCNGSSLPCSVTSKTDSQFFIYFYFSYAPRGFVLVVGMVSILWWISTECPLVAFEIDIGYCHFRCLQHLCCLHVPPRPALGRQLGNCGVHLISCGSSSQNGMIRCCCPGPGS